MARNCWVEPRPMLAEVGETATDTSAAAVTVKLVDPEIDPALAAMLAIPVLTLVASPVAFTVATFVAEDVHVTVLVRFCVLPSEKVPVADNCWAVPSGMEGAAGLIAIPVNTAAMTVKLSVPVTGPSVDEMVTVPWATDCARPVEPIETI